MASGRKLVTWAFSHPVHRHTRFRYAFRLPLIYTPWLLLQEEGYNTASTFRSTLSRFHFVCNDAHAISSCNHLVSDLFHTHTCGFFSTFARATYSLSVSGQCLGLEFNAPVFAQRTKAVLLSYGQFHTRFAYEAVTLFGRSFQSVRLARTQVRPHHISHHLRNGIQLALCRFHSPLLTTSRLISFPVGTKMLQFPACACATIHGAPFGYLRFKG